MTITRPLTPRPRRRFSGRRILSAASLLLLTAVSTSCGLDKIVAHNDKCGDLKKDTFILVGNLMVTSGTFLEGMSGGQRRYFWSRTYNNVCTQDEGQTEATFALVFNTIPMNGLTAEARAYQHRILQPYRATLTRVGDDELRGTVGNIGLEQYYNKGPGTMELELLVTFPATADAAADRARFVNAVLSIKWEAQYPAYKAP
jgi:hypothetical protein